MPSRYNHGPAYVIPNQKQRKAVKPAIAPYPPIVIQFSDSVSFWKNDTGAHIVGSATGIPLNISIPAAVLDTPLCLLCPGRISRVHAEQPFSSVDHGLDKAGFLEVIPDKVVPVDDDFRL